MVYRPGSALEKGQLLRRIESPEPATTTQEARDLKLSTPDPSLLVKVLDGMLRKPVTDSPEVGFRMNLLRYHLKVDFSPSEDSVLAIHRAFLAEFEQMGYQKRRPASDPTPGPRMRAMEKDQLQLPASPSTAPKGARKPCRFYLSDEGCRRGKACRFEHTMKDLSKAERRDRCYECGGKGHLATSCPTKKEAQQKVLNANDSPQSSTGGTSGNKKGGQGARRSAEEQAAEVTGTTATTSPAPTPVVEPPVQGVPVEQLLEALEDAQRLMKPLWNRKQHQL